jgi:hypothetical protein
MSRPICRRRPLSLGQRFLGDYLHFSNRGQTAAAERLMRIPDVVAARQAAVPRPSWGAIMTKAFALAAQNHPEMRSAYLSFPWGHTGEYASQIASVIVNRRVGDGDVIFLAPLASPDQQSLCALDDHLRRYQTAPLESIRAFRSAVRIGRLPGVIRRLLWWLSLNVMPRQRARHFGTFGVTTMSPFGARTLEVPSLWSALLHYGGITPEGDIPVGIAFDHRLMNGAVVGYTLLEMEQALHHQIAAELRGMARPSTLPTVMSAWLSREPAGETKPSGS